MNWIKFREVFVSGHSQFKNIMYRKGAQDAKRAKVFSKISREITVAVKNGGAIVESNARLKAALINARAENMPKDNIDRAIKKALGNEDTNDYSEVRYEGYGPGGVAIIVEGLTDNKNRTAPDVRSAFNKFGGSLGESGSVSFQFKHIGYIEYEKSVADEETFWEVAIESGADDVDSSDDLVYSVSCEIGSLSSVRDSLIAKFGDPKVCKVIWKPENTVPVDDNTAATLFKLIDTLEDNDDIQSVTANYEVSDQFLKQFGE